MELFPAYHQSLTLQWPVIVALYVLYIQFMEGLRLCCIGYYNVMKIVCLPSETVSVPPFESCTAKVGHCYRVNHLK